MMAGGAGARVVLLSHGRDGRRCLLLSRLQPAVVALDALPPADGAAKRPLIACLGVP
jgi:hypothetical protein